MRRFDPEKEAKLAMKTVQKIYDDIKSNIEKGIDKDATGSDRLNEMKSLMFGASQLKELIKQQAALQEMINKGDYVDKEPEWKAETEKFIEG